MNILTLDHITKSYTDRLLFDDASFYLQEGEKVGIIGINGTGKSTLLKIAAGIEEPDEGTVIRANNQVVKYLPQNPEFLPEETALQAVVRIAGAEHLEHWDQIAEAKNMMTRLGITDFDEPTAHLSGGQRKRLALVGVLLSRCEVLVLDEPTNHLDSDMASWLEDYLRSYRGSFLMVTHDRYFLDSVSNRIIEIDKGKIYSYQTNYTGFLQLKAEREAMELASERKRQSILRKEIEWIMRGARARSTKQKAHIQRYEALCDMEGPKVDESLAMSSVSTRMGKTTVELSHIKKSYGDNVLIKDFSYIFLKNDRIGFIGKNGCGKTTLMKIIAGRVPQDDGTVVIGQTIKLGYYTQEIENDKSAGLAYMDPKERVIDYIKNTAEYVRTTDGLVSASAMLERFLFTSDMQYSPIGKLSGGEKRRLNLLRVLMEAPNVLILDEPTNDLDIRTLTILEDYLDTYEGIVITVSHDRYFLDRVVRRIFAFDESENGELIQHEGGYTDYENRMKEQKKEVATSEQPSEKVAVATDSRATWKSGRKLKFTYKEQKEYETIEADIEALEETIASCEKEMLACARDFVKLNEITAKKEAAEETLLEKMERWEYLEDLAAKIAAQ